MNVRKIKSNACVAINGDAVLHISTEQNSTEIVVAIDPDTDETTYAVVPSGALKPLEKNIHQPKQGRTAQLIAFIRGSHK